MSGYPVVGYYDGTNEDLEVLHCNDPDGSGAKPGPTATPTPAGPVADVNCDGAVSALDALSVLQYAAGVIGLLPCHENADVNRDGAVNAIDAALVLRYDAGLLASLPP